MLRLLQNLGAISLALALVACTDWDAKGGAQEPVLSSVPGNGNLGLDDAQSGGIKPWETWLPPGTAPYDAGTTLFEDLGAADGESSDILALSDDASAVDAGTDAPVIEVTVVDAEGPDVEDIQNAADTAVADLIAADGEVGDSGPDIDPACAGKNRPLGCYCSASSQCGSGLCVYGPTGLVCGVSCKTFGCPGGWVCTPPALVCIPAPLPDVAPDVPIQSDLGSIDGGGQDSTPADGIASDIAVIDAPVADAPVGDSGPSDGGLAVCNVPGSPYCPCNLNVDCQSGVCLSGTSGGYCAPTCVDKCPDGFVCKAVLAGGNDIVFVCSQIAADAQADAVSEIGDDAAIGDAQVSDVDQGDAGGFDQAVGDGGLVDTANGDIVDGAIGVDAPKFDWQGYPDANFPADADIYGGPINSCLSLFLFQQETCGKNNPSATCIDTIANKGSLYANYIFEPLRACETAICTDLCALAVDETCMNQCMGKYCTGPFLGCVSNDSSANADCAATWTCAQQYPGKLLTIGAICYANASKDAQVQLDGLISCSTKPQTESCFKQIGKCFQSASPTASCNQTLQCSQACGGDQVCTWNCLGNASAAGIQLADALFNCINTNCTPICNGDKTCQDKCTATQCNVQMADCLTK